MELSTNKICTLLPDDSFSVALQQATIFTPLTSPPVRVLCSYLGPWWWSLRLSHCPDAVWWAGGKEKQRNNSRRIDLLIICLPAVWHLAPFSSVFSLFLVICFLFALPCMQYEAFYTSAEVLRSWITVLLTVGDSWCGIQSAQNGCGATTAVEQYQDIF